jgi:hypothetical protein
MTLISNNINEDIRWVKEQFEINDVNVRMLEKEKCEYDKHRRALLIQKYTRNRDRYWSLLCHLIQLKTHQRNHRREEVIMSDKLKLKCYNLKNSSKVRKSNPTIWFHRKGLMHLSKKTIDMINFKDGDRIEFHQNEAEPGEWYICKSIDGDGFLLKEKKQQGKYLSLSTCSAGVVRSIMKSMNLDPDDVRSLSCKVSSRPVTHGGKSLYCLITSDAKINRA